MVLIPPLMRLAEWLHVLDIPGERKLHKVAIPRIGGIAMATGAVLPLIMWLPPQRPVVAYLCGAAILLFFGFWDDRKNLDYRLKFLGQMIAVLVVVLYGGVVIKHIPFFLRADALPAYIGVPLTVFALVGVTNAINLADGLDGLAAGMTLLSLGMIALMAYMTDSITLVLMTVAVIGSIFGFLRFNTYPARIFMGDAGSQFLGFSLGVLVVMLTQEANPALSSALPFMILGLPIVDTLMVMGQRIHQGRSAFSPDNNHIHHKFLSLGFDHYGAVFVIYLLQSILVLGAYFLRFESDLLILCLYVVFCVTLLSLLRIASARGWRIHGHRPEIHTPIHWLRSGQRLLKVALYFALITIPAYFLLGVLFVEKVPKDIGVVAWMLLAILLMLYLKRSGKAFSIIEKAGAYIACVFVVYLTQVTPGVLAEYAIYRNTLLAALAMAVAIGFRFSKERFQITPLDFLVIFIALTLPNLPDLNVGESHLGATMGVLIVLFYGIELVLNNIQHRWNLMRFVTCATLAVLGLRGVTGMSG
jgi:UDP-GlcNAc:undecaprenyl-phosphate GlcNAc-1-phosphate transferase